MTKKIRTIVLLSGGLDSAVVLAGCVASGDECLAVGFDYGQPHVVELEAAQAIADYYKVPLEILDTIPVAKIDDQVFAGRNLLFASVAISLAQARSYDRIAIGCNASDWQVFPDCRPVFWNALKQAVSDAYGVTIVTPLIHNSKLDIVQAARELEVPIDMTWSCYAPRLDPEHGDHRPCGECLACITRNQAMHYAAA